MPDAPRIATACPRCLAGAQDNCALHDDVRQFDCPEEDGGAIALVALDDLPEKVVEDLRAKHLQANTVDSTAEVLGPPPEGVKDANLEDPLAEALANPILAPGEGATPEAALEGAAGPDDVPESGTMSE